MRLYIKFQFSSEGKNPLEVVKMMQEMGFTPEVGDYDFSIPFRTPEQYSEVLTELKRSGEIIAEGKIPVFGGMIPGYTTDSVAALLAEYLHGTFINLSNVKGVFDSDPKFNPNAKFYEKLNYSELLSFLSAMENKPRQHVILDVPCALILKRSKIKTIVLDAKNMQNFENAVQGKKFEGTTIEA